MVIYMWSKIKETLKTTVSPVLIAAILVVPAFGIGFFTGQANPAEASFVMSSNQPKDVDLTLFWKAWDLLDEKYVDTHASSTHATSTKVTNEERIYGAINGMVASLGDPYTTFFTPQQATEFQSQIEGNFEGVGMELGIKDDILTVIAAIKSTPAEQAGIRSGDKILKIDDTLTVDMTIEKAVRLIRGKKGTTVKFIIGREGRDPFEVSVVRDVINLPTIDTKYDKETQIFTIRIYSFSANSSTLFRNALRDFVATNSNKLILDLRGNPGGYLEAAVDMASWFLPSGKVVVREDYGSSQPETAEKSKGYNIFSQNLKMIILVDGGSASASEILAGALSEYGKATLVGTKTFGKGSVQEFHKLDDNTALKVTVAKWLTPNGISISANGLTPQVIVKVTAEDIAKNNDVQMQKAIELLR